MDKDKTRREFTPDEREALEAEAFALGYVPDPGAIRDISCRRTAPHTYEVHVDRGSGPTVEATVRKDPHLNRWERLG